MVDRDLLIHPGEILREEFLEPHGLAPSQLAVRLGLPPNRITRLVNGEVDVTHETAVLLGAVFGTTAEFWMNLQTKYNLDAGVDRVSPDKLDLAHRLHDEIMEARRVEAAA